MDFGTAPAPLGSPDIDDVTRATASARVNTVMPAHSLVTADDLSDERIVTEHIVGPAIANATNDTELTPGDTAINIASHRVHHVALITSVSISLILAVCLVAIIVVLT